MEGPRRKLVGVALALIGGVVSGAWLQLPAAWAGVWLGSALAATGILFFWRRAVWMGILATAYLAGILDASVHQPRPIPLLETMAFQTVMLEGTIEDIVTGNRGLPEYQMQVKGLIKGRYYGLHATVILIRPAPISPGAVQTVNRGDAVRARGMLLLRPGQELQDSRYQLDADPQGIQIMKASAGSWTASFRSRLGRWLDDSYGSRIGGFYSALLFGMREKTPRDIITVFTSLGIVHILAVSGLHVQLFLWPFRRIWERWGGERNRTAHAGLAAVAVVYVLLAGAGASVVRAGTMAVLYHGGRIAGRERDALTAIAVAAIGEILHDPGTLWSVGFQLSYVVTLALLLLLPVALRCMSRLPQIIREPLAMCLVAEVAAFPLVIDRFHTWNWLSIPANLYAGVWVAFWIPLGLVGLILAFFPVIGTFIRVAVPAVVQQLLWPLDVLHRITGSHISFAAPGGVWICVVYTSLALFRLAVVSPRSFSLRRDTMRAHRKIRNIRIGTGLAAGSLYLAAFVPVHGESVSFVAVAAGQATLFQDGDHGLLVDTGSVSPNEWVSEGERIVLPFLRERGVNRLDGIVVTSMNASSLLSIRAIVQEMPVDSIVFAFRARRYAGQRRVWHWTPGTNGFTLKMNGWEIELGNQWDGRADVFRETFPGEVQSESAFPAVAISDKVPMAGRQAFALSASGTLTIDVPANHFRGLRIHATRDPAYP